MKWITGLTFTYVAALVMWFGLWLVIGDGVWWMVVLNRYVPQMFVPAPLIILLTIFSRRSGLIAVSLIPLLIFGLLYWPYAIPRPSRPDTQPNLRVMTYNVLFSNLDYDAVANVILTHQPDLVALQEVQPKMMAELTDQLGEMYPYSLIGDEHPYGTTAAFSRYPIDDSYVLDLEADRPATVLKIEMDGTEITFISAHLLAYGLQWVSLPDIPQTINQRTSSQKHQANLLVEEVQKQTGTVILACDCNSKETSASHRILTETMTNAARAAGWVIGGSTIAGAQQDTNLQHIDYVFYRGGLEPVNVYSIRDSGGSDHLPIIALFNFENVRRFRKN